MTDSRTAPECPTHKPVQHRDGKPPWCRACGWTDPVPAIPAVQVKIASKSDRECLVCMLYGRTVCRAHMANGAP